jgi:hypothetical protein
VARRLFCQSRPLRDAPPPIARSHDDTRASSMAPSSRLQTTPSARSYRSCWSEARSSRRCVPRELVHDNALHAQPIHVHPEHIVTAYLQHGQ